MSTAHQQVKASHPSRDAYLYVCQPAPRQIFEHEGGEEPQTAVDPVQCAKAREGSTILTRRG